MDVEEKSLRVKNYHHATIESFLELCGAMGLEDPDALTPSDLLRRSDDGIRSFSQLNTPLQPGQLLTDDLPAQYSADWALASADSF